MFWKWSTQPQKATLGQLVILANHYNLEQPQSLKADRVDSFAGHLVNQHISQGSQNFVQYLRCEKIEKI
jgi:hypothetical protein